MAVCRTSKEGANFETLQASRSEYRFEDGYVTTLAANGGISLGPGGGEISLWCRVTGAATGAFVAGQITAVEVGSFF